MSLATLKPKVEELIDKAEDEALWYHHSGERTDIAPWRYSTVERLPRMSLEKMTSLATFFTHMANLKRADYYIDAKNCTNFAQLFASDNLLEYVKGVNTSKATNVLDMFYQCSSLKTIEEPLDFSNRTSTGGVFGACVSLENVKFVTESIKISITILSPVLSAESIQSIIDGLATVETAQTLTLHTDVKAKLTQTQLDTITGKNWSLA